MSFQLEASPSHSTDKAHGSDSHSSGWLMDDVIHPLVNSALIEPYDVVAQLTNTISDSNLMPECKPLEVPDAKTASAAWAAQAISGGIGSLVPFVVAGKLTGGVMKGGGRLLEATPALEALDFGGATSKLLASDRVAAIVGAGLYAGARQPGQGETRIGDAIGTMVGFGAFEYGNKWTSGLSLGASIPIRAMVGAAGGLGQYEVSNLVSNQSLGTSRDAFRAMLSGGALNVLLPAAERGLKSAHDTVALKLGRPISAESYAERSGWTNNSKVSSLIEKSPLTLVRTVDSETSIDHKANVINLNPKDGEGGLVHELSHRVGFLSNDWEAKFQQAAGLLKSNSEQAWQVYRGARAGEEQSARQAENQALIARGLEPSRQTSLDQIGSSVAANGRTYDDVWRQEFEQFKASNGSFRPTIDYSGGGSPDVVTPTSLTETLAQQQLANPNANNNDTRVIETLRHEVPEDWWFGKVVSEQVRQDGSKVYRLSEGNPDYGLQAGDTVEWYPEGVQAHLRVDGTPQVINVETVLHGSGKTTYISTDGDAYESLYAGPTSFTVGEPGGGNSETVVSQAAPPQPQESDGAQTATQSSGSEVHTAPSTNIGESLKVSAEAHMAQPDESFTIIKPGERVTALEGQRFFAQAGATVFAEAGSHVVADMGATVHAYEGSMVVAKPGSIVKAYFGANVVASPGANIQRFGGTTVMDRSGNITPNFQRSPLKHSYFGR